jgi:hypothetical protein
VVAVLVFWGKDLTALAIIAVVVAVGHPDQMELMEPRFLVAPEVAGALMAVAVVAVERLVVMRQVAPEVLAQSVSFGPAQPVASHQLVQGTCNA